MNVDGEWGGTGDGPGEFRWASSIAVGPDLRVYVGDRRGGRVTVFSASGTLLKTIPVARAIRDIADLLVLPNGNLVVAADVMTGESIGAYVAIIDSTGAAIHKVLSASRPEAGRQRPLLGHRINVVRISAGANGQFDTAACESKWITPLFGFT